MRSGKTCFPSQPRIRDRAFGGGVAEFGVFGEDAPGVAGFGLLPLGEAGFDFAVGDAQGELAGDRVDADRVAAFDDGEGAAAEGFGGDVADQEAVAAAAEPAVGDEGEPNLFLRITAIWQRSTNCGKTAGYQWQVPERK
jgi:hypothetical protein